MVVVMAQEATAQDVDAVVDLVRTAGGEAFVSRGVSRTIVGLVGDIEQFQALNLRGLRGVGEVVRISVAVQAGQQGEPSGQIGRAGGRGADRPGHPHGHRGPVRGGDPAAGARRRADGEGRRRCAAARRRVQAAHVALRVPGARREGPEDPRRRAGGNRASRGDRGSRRGRCRTRLQLRRHAPDRHPQHAELRPAAGGGRRRKAGHAEARNERHHRGMADGRRVHRPARQPRHRAV